MSGGSVVDDQRALGDLQAECMSGNVVAGEQVSDRSSDVVGRTQAGCNVDGEGEIKLGVARVPARDRR